MKTSIFLLLVALGFASILQFGESKVFGRCDFVRALRKYGVPSDQVATWTCIANYESHFNTKAHNTVTGDFGILQISQIYWCSNSGSAGGGCNIACSKLLNDDISDDVACARKVFSETQRFSGNGFTAWTTYKPYCSGDNSGWVSGC